MDITPAPSKDLHLIQSYGGGRFIVRDHTATENLLVWPTGMQAMGNGELSVFEVAELINPLPELLIIGTGLTMQMIPKEFKEAIKKQQVKIEPMDTGAACRTYNVLANEDRRIAALLKLV